MRRPLSETLVDLAVPLMRISPGDLTEGLRVTRLDLAVPIEVRFHLGDEGTVLLADVPSWRWQTGLEELRGRLTVRWEEGGDP
jgi:hypothetical protein